MNRKGEITVGTSILLFVGIIVALAIFSAFPASVAQITQTSNVVNQSVTAPAAGSTSTILSGQAVSNVIVINASSGNVIPASNYTITNYVVSNGVVVNTFTSNTGLLGFQSRAINVSYTMEPFGYATDSGTRAIIPLILVFAALAIAVFVIVPSLRDGIVNFISR